MLDFSGFLDPNDCYPALMGASYHVARTAGKRIIQKPEPFAPNHKFGLAAKRRCEDKKITRK